MKLISFRRDGQSRLGIVTENGVLDVAAAVEGGLPASAALPGSVMEAIRGGEAAQGALRQLVETAASQGADVSYLLREQELDVMPCVTHPPKMICIGLNYRNHAKEMNLPLPESPILFSKFNNALAGHGDDILLPKPSAKVDYEAELAIVIGKQAKHVEEADALEYVFGYCNANDLSARDLQNKTSQWLLGKSCDGFAPIGPYLVTADEIADPDNLRITCTVNGELRQNSNTADMVFNCKQLISYISRHMTLEPGDLILTGTPEGVASSFPPDNQPFLRSGDIVTIEIEGLGTLTNRMVNE